MASVSELIISSDDPPDPAPPYPGKWGRNNLQGLSISKQEYLDQKTDEWLAYVSSKPSYQVTAMAHKARCLQSHLRATFRKSDKNASAECRDLIERAEARSKGENEENMEVDGGNAQFDGGDDGGGEVKRVKQDFVESFLHSPLARERREEYGMEVVRQKSDEELLELGESEKHVKESKAYKKWAEKLPAWLCDTKGLFVAKDSLGLLRKQGKSELLVMESVCQTLEALRVSKTKESKEQQLVIAASLSSVKYGVPSLGFNTRDKKEATEMKNRLLSGEDKVLKGAEMSPRQHFPPEVAKVGKDHWNEITITEPAKHLSLTKAVKDGDETLPDRLFLTLLAPTGALVIFFDIFRWQTMTNEEAYESFKENCREPVRALIEEHGKNMLEKVSKRPDSVDKDYRIALAWDWIPDRFPSLSWFLEQRPPEVKACNDHATGLCKVRQSLFYQPQFKCNHLVIFARSD